MHLEQRVTNLAKHCCAEVEEVALVHSLPGSWSLDPRHTLTDYWQERILIQARLSGAHLRSACHIQCD